MDKTMVLKDFPYIPSDAALNVLLWDDPLFGHDVETDKTQILF